MRRLVRLLRSEGVVRQFTDDKVGQALLIQNFLAAIAAGRAPAIGDVGFRNYSQFEEDGVILFLCTAVRVKRRICLEMCCGVGFESNTANLIVNHGWTGVLFDGDPERVGRAREFYRHNPDTFYAPPHVGCEWITVENVDQIVAAAGLAGEIGLLSLDIDGNDYWIWETLSVVAPEIVVCEVNNNIPPTEAVTIPYAAGFSRDGTYFGASLAAMNSLAQRKGYRLVGMSRHGINAFFVRRDAALAEIPTLTPEHCFLTNDFVQQRVKANWPALSRREWVRVG